MLELTRTPLMDGSGNVQICLVAPGHQADQIARALEGVLGLAEQLSDEIVSLPPSQLTKVFKGARKRAELSQAELALELALALPDAKVKYRQRHISQMETGNRPITETEAKALAKILNTDPRCFTE